MIRARRVFDAGRQETAIFATLAVALVLFRCFVPAWYEDFDFDSDQAVVGLMAKHLAELRVFPLFFYGQNYMLGVQAWLAAPLFALAHPSLRLLRLPLVAINCAVAAALIVGLIRTLKLRPALAFVAALPFIMPPPLVASHLLQTLGASVEPFLYILLLWALRGRPWLFGAVLGVGFLHREFTIFALPALLVAQALDGTLMKRETWSRFDRAAASFAVVWLVVDVLKLQVNGSGPRVGDLQTGPLTLQMQMLVDRLCFSPQELLARFKSFFVDCLPDLLGTRRLPLSVHGLNSATPSGSVALAWILPALAVIMAVTPGRGRDDGQHRRSGLCWYLALVGVQAVLAYPLSCEIAPGHIGLLRYALLPLFIPIACFAWHVSRERSRALTAIVACGFVAWAAINFSENMNLVREYQTSPPPSKFRTLADYLTSHRIKYASAGYWDSYIVDFMTRERVIVASTGKVRVTEYQQLVDQHKDAAVQIDRTPCSGGVRVEAWCITGPPLP